jgi:hypothetical protein
LQGMQELALLLLMFPDSAATAKSTSRNDFLAVVFFFNQNLFTDLLGSERCGCGLLRGFCDMTWFYCTNQVFRPRRDYKM